MDRDARVGRRRAFQRLYRRHRAELYDRLLLATGSEREAERLTQTALLDAYWAYTRGQAPAEPRRWLFQVAERARSRRRLLHRTPAPAGAEERAVVEISQALDRLEDEERSVLLLREIGGFSREEIADELDLAPAEVDGLLTRSRRALGEAADRVRSRRGRYALLLWLTNLSSWGERTAPAARAAGAVAAAALSVGVVLGTGALPGEAADSPPADRSPLTREPLPSPSPSVGRTAGVQRGRPAEAAEPPDAVVTPPVTIPRSRQPEPRREPVVPATPRHPPAAPEDDGLDAPARPAALPIPGEAVSDTRELLVPALPAVPELPPLPELPALPEPAPVTPPALP